MAHHETLGRFRLVADAGPDGSPPEWLFTENESNHQRLFGSANEGPYVKDAFHEYVVGGNKDAVRRDEGTKAASLYVIDVPARQEVIIRLRLTPDSGAS